MVEINKQKLKWIYIEVKVLIWGEIVVQKTWCAVFEVIELDELGKCFFSLNFLKKKVRSLFDCFGYGFECFGFKVSCLSSSSRLFPVIYRMFVGLIGND